MSSSWPKSCAAGNGLKVRGKRANWHLQGLFTPGIAALRMVGRDRLLQASAGHPSIRGESCDPGDWGPSAKLPGLKGETWATHTVLDLRSGFHAVWYHSLALLRLLVSLENIRFHAGTIRQRAMRACECACHAETFSSGTRELTCTDTICRRKVQTLSK